MREIRALALMALFALPGLPAEKTKADKGKQEFQEQCSVCHAADSDQKKMGPGLKGLFKRYSLRNGRKPTEANVRTQIDRGGNGMPAYQDMLSDREKDDLIAYLKTL